jgi:DNA-binding CsgD family transcriptional regulator/Tfp pilus assembly protein PilF
VRGKGEQTTEAQFPSPIICPVLIGRAQELTYLRLLVDRARNGQEQVVLLSGEAGIGKSRLVAEAKAYAAAHGFLLLEGQCFQTDSASPYAPLLDLFRAYFARRTPTSLPDPMHSFASMLLRLLPELALQFPDLTNVPAPLPGEPEEEKRRLFAAMTHFVTEQAAQQPLLLVVEDIHWCDDLSLDLLLHLARRLRQAPLLLLVTYRSEEMHPHLRRWLTQLDRERLAQEYSLARLSRAEVRVMLQALLETQQAIDAHLLDTLYTHSEGNPFFVEELLTSLMTAGELVCFEGIWKLSTQRAPVPRSVQETVQQRVAYLNEDAKRLLTLAAVSGRRFNITLLQEVMQCDEAHLLTLLKELIAAQLVMEEAADQFAFRHALTQQAILSSLLLRERKALHRTLAETLEQLCATSHVRERYLEDLAYHSFEAGMWEQALAYAQEVGEKVLSLYAQQVAIDHFTRAIEAAHHFSQTPPPALYLKRGQAYETLGDFERARGDYERALDAARAVHDGTMEWQCMIALGFLWTGHDYERADVWFRQALALAERLADPELRARSLNRLGNWLLNTGHLQEALHAHQEALSLFETRADREGIAETLDMLGITLFFLGDTARAVKDYYGRAIELLRGLDDRQSLFHLLAMRALDAAPEALEVSYSALLTREECVGDVEEARLLARQTNSLSGQAFVEMAATYVLSSFGEFGQALTHAQEGLRIAISIDHQEWIAATNGGLGFLYFLLLEADRAVACLEAGVAAAQASDSAIQLNVLTPHLALAYLNRGEFSRAEATFESIMPHEQQPRNFFERQVARVRGELALAQGEPSRALAIAENLLISAPGDMHQPIPHLLSLKGQALLALERLQEAAVALEEAKVGAELRQAPSILWRIQRSLGQVYHLLKREEQAQHEWSEAQGIINRLATTIDAIALREHFLQAALQSFPQEVLQPARRSVSERYNGLTEREIEVLRAVAQGLTDTQVAERLVISPRTVHSHLNSIYSKLGITSRSAATRYAIEHHLA